MIRTRLLSILLVAPALLAQAPTVDQVLTKYCEAKGGLAKMKAVNSMRITAKMSGGPMDFPIVIEAKRPASIRVDVNIQGNQIIQAYDGKVGWSINPFQQSAKKDAEPMTPDEIRDIEVQADMDGPLVDWQAKGHKVELQGHEPVEGSDALKVKLTLKNGDVRTIFLDADTYLEVKQVSKRKVRDTEIEAESTLGDYKDVGGLMVAHSIENGVKGSPQKQKIVIEKVEFNVPIADSRFAMPAKPAAPEAPKKDEPAASKK
jgi:outer membrane lipoprotein-sorting protein